MLVRLLDPGKNHEVLQVSLVRTARTWIVEIGKPFGFSRNGRELVELGRRQQSVAPCG